MIPALPLAVVAFLALFAAATQDVSPEEQRQIESAVPDRAPADPKRPRRIFVCNLSVRDGQVRPGHASIPVGNLAFELMGKRTGAYEAVFSNEVSMFRRESLSRFDAICFLNTTGVLFDDPELRESLLGFVRDGRGFIGFHAAAATFVQYPRYDQWPAFGEMLGGYENGGHPWKAEESFWVKVDDRESPLTAMFSGQGFRVSDEVFQFREQYSRDRVRVLLSIDTERTGVGSERRLLPERRQDLDLPVSWIRAYGKGRVFYTFLGHNKEPFWSPQLLRHFLAGIQFAVGDLSADAAPNGHLRIREPRE